MDKMKEIDIPNPRSYYFYYFYSNDYKILEQKNNIKIILFILFHAKPNLDKNLYLLILIKYRDILKSVTEIDVSH